MSTTRRRAHGSPRSLILVLRHQRYKTSRLLYPIPRAMDTGLLGKERASGAPNRRPSWPRTHFPVLGLFVVAVFMVGVGLMFSVPVISLRYRPTQSMLLESSLDMTSRSGLHRFNSLLYYCIPNLSWLENIPRVHMMHPRVYENIWCSISC